MKQSAIRAAALLLILGVTLVTSGQVLAHAGSQLMPLRLTVTSWASAIQGDDGEAVAGLLDRDFPGRERYLRSLPFTPITRVALQYANYSIDGARARVSPVVLFPRREMNNPHAYTLELVERDGNWLIGSIVATDEIPQELKIKNHPLMYETHEVSVNITDADSGSSIHTRVHIRDDKGVYWAPQGHRQSIAEGWREDVGGDVIVEGKTFAYVSGDFKISLPEGQYQMEVKRGPEYIPESTTFTVKADRVPEVGIELERWIHMAGRGWYSGDSHTHFLDPHTALLEAQGEDLNVINVLASSGGNLITSVNHFTGAPSVISTLNHIVYIGEETRHDYLGHTVLLNLQELIYPFGWGEPTTGVWDGYDYPTMAHQADKTRAEGALVAWSHLPHPYAELPIDVALGKIDAVEAMVFGDPLVRHPTRVDMGHLTPAAVSPVELWYALLNTGFDMPALGSTDKMWNTQVSGSARTYVQIDGEFTYQAWIDGIRSGRTFFTTGPMLNFSVENVGVGSKLSFAEPQTVSFQLEVNSHVPVERLEILANGKVVASQDNWSKKKEVTLRGKIDLKQSSWIAARAYSSEKLPYQAHLTGEGSPLMAHTSPVYVEIDGQLRVSAHDAAFLVKICDETITWAKTMAHYASQEQRDEVIALYTRARNIYARQLGRQ